MKEEPQVDKNNKIQDSKSLQEKQRPKSGLSLWIGKSVEEMTAQFGEPKRIDNSSYGYDWWVYTVSEQQYIQFAIDKSKIVSVYAIGSDVNASPYTLGQSLEEIYQFTIIEQEIVIKDGSGSYQFELTEEDLNTRLLVEVGDIYAQLYLDKYTGKLISVRFLDKETLIKMRPYEMVYRGELAEEKELTEEEWEKHNIGSEQQIFDITNIIRKQFNKSVLKWDEETALVARKHSQEMLEEEYFAHESPVFGSLSDRLNKADIPYQKAGENIAAQYIDGPAAVHGWLNSEGHRKTLLEKDFTHLGVGVDRKYYTQNFLEEVKGM